MKKPPVINIANLLGDAAALARLDTACREWGFFYITGHGVAPELCTDVQTQTRTFFDLPLNEKRRIIRSDKNVWGFYDDELTKNVRDLKEVFDVGPPESEGPVAGAQPQWPGALPAFRPALEAFMEAGRNIGQRLIAAIGANLGMPADHLVNAFYPEDSSFLRLNYYPVSDDPAPPDASTEDATGRLGINHHTDSGALTVLLQDEHAGLQVYKDNSWHTVQPIPDSFVINIGDIVQVWSNDLYAAPLHRVIASSGEPRYSVPYFFNPAYATEYAPLPSACDDSNAAKYRPINWGEFRAGRAAGDYADYGNEIQIADFCV